MPRLLIAPTDLFRSAKSILDRFTSSPDTDEAVAGAPAAGGRAGKYDDPLVSIVMRRPGVLVADAATELGVHPTALYPVIRRLESRGRLVKLARELHPPQASRLEQLWCNEGHAWSRPTVRGRKPLRCPDHR